MAAAAIPMRCLIRRLLFARLARRAGFSIIGAAQIRCMRILCLIRVEIEAVGTAVEIV
jgi:hypothetical protein